MPTWKGWLVLLAASALLFNLLLRSVHPFLAMNARQPSGVLVVEGWTDDHVMASALAEFTRNRYEMLIATGGLIEKGAPFSEFKTWSEFGAATLRRMGAASNAVFAVTPRPVLKDRTYTSALAVREWLRARGPLPPAINVMSSGAHSRRTWLMYRMAFGKELKVGIIAAEETNYDTRRWWKSSQGFRVVLDEMIAYAYAKLLFRPEKE